MTDGRSHIGAKKEVNACEGLNSGRTVQFRVSLRGGEIENKNGEAVRP